MLIYTQYLGLPVTQSLREELELKQPRVLSLFDEVRQLSSNELLSRDETDALQRPLAQCRGRLELCQERSERLARRLTAALEELLKYTVCTQSRRSSVMLRLLLFWLFKNVIVPPEVVNTISTLIIITIF